MSVIGIRLMLRWEDCFGWIKTDKNFERLSSFDKLDLLNDWRRQLDRLWTEAHNRVYPGLQKRKEDHDLSVCKAIENLEDFHKKNPDDTEGLAKLALAIIEARIQDC